MTLIEEFDTTLERFTLNDKPHVASLYANEQKKSESLN
jgi:hypothetical protein